MKELKFKEVIANIKEGETYTCTDMNYNIRKINNYNGCLDIEYANASQKVLGIPDDAKFIKEQKPVDFMTAIKAFDEGKTIECIVNGATESIYKPYKEYGSFQCLYDGSQLAITQTEILKGEWYIREA